MSTTMIPLDVALWRDLFLLTAVAVEQQYIPLHRDILADLPESEDVTGGVESSHNSRKRVLSVDWNAGRSLKRAKDNAGDVVVTCSASKIQLKLGKENDEMTEDLGSISAPVHRRINPLPKRAEGNQRSMTSLPDVDISWIPKSYRNGSRKTPDTRLHKLFLSECNYSLTEYHENGTVKKKGKEEREAFLRADEWVEVRGGYEVRCRACKYDIALDSREGMYYPNLWIKHRSGCPTVYTIWLERNGLSQDSDKEWFRNKKTVH